MNHPPLHGEGVGEADGWGAAGAVQGLIAAAPPTRPATRATLPARERERQKLQYPSYRPGLWLAIITALSATAERIDSSSLSQLITAKAAATIRQSDAICTLPALIPRFS